MQTQIADFFSTKIAPALDQLRDLENSIDAEQPVKRDTHYSQLGEVLNQVVQDCTVLDAALQGNDLLAPTRSRFQAELSPWLTKGWIGHRSITKPRGYAGDHALLTRFYDYGPLGTGYAGYVDLWISDLLLAKSIRARWQGIRQFLTDELSRRGGEVRVLNIASGPLREFARPLELTQDCKIHLQCLDNDSDSLDYVQEHVEPSCGIANLRLDRYNALRLKSSATTRDAFGKFDVIYSIGLFDYIDDERLVGILSGLRETLAEGGAIYLNFKDSERYNKVEYQWLLDWHFFQRTEQDCLQLFEQAGYTMSRMEPTTRDETGVIINFVNRVADKTFRFDTGHGPAVPAKKSGARTRQQDSASQETDV